MVSNAFQRQEGGLAGVRARLSDERKRNRWS